MFILYSTTRANEVAGENNRRTVHSQDVLNAIDSLGFEHMIPELIKWHSVYIEERELSKSKKKRSSDESLLLQSSTSNETLEKNTNDDN